MSSAFARTLRSAGGNLVHLQKSSTVFPKEDWLERDWFFVPYDQLHQDLPPWAELDSSRLGFVLIESRSKARRRLYHKQKLALVLANQRHFACEQAARGVAVQYLIGEAGYAEALGCFLSDCGVKVLRVPEPAERELRLELAPLVQDKKLELVSHGGWLTTPDQFNESCPTPPYRFDSFYRRVRRDRGWLMESGKPVGGKWSFDAENRKPWKGEFPAPERLKFPVDAIKSEVGSLVESDFGDHPGKLDLDYLPATLADAQNSWSWALRFCLQHFGPFEDAMTEASTGLFHTRIAPLLNLHRLLPEQIVESVLASEFPLACREGFLRQVAGWREFVRHVHRETNGFENLVKVSGESLPQTFWGDAPSGLRCLDHTVETVWREGYSHHITRLMVLGNLATLLEVDALELRDWFWVAYTDAYDWVVDPNVLGMATWATHGVMTTKPYISGAAYLNRMGDHCSSCDFHPKKNCPITHLYWAWMERHASELKGNVRMAMPLKSLSKRSPEKRNEDREVFFRVREALANRERFTP